MAPEEDCEKEKFVEIRWQDRTIGVPLAQSEGIEVDEGTKQAMHDRCYWTGRGYEF